MDPVAIILLGAAVALTVPVMVLFAQVSAAVLLPQPLPLRQRPCEPRPRIAVLVPAHNESGNLLPTLLDVKRQLTSHDCVLVVADNCTDDTAAVAARYGAMVVERNDLQKIGKGYALDHGIRRLALDPPDIVIVIDADCRLSGGILTVLAATAALTGRPAQALYLMTGPPLSIVDYQFAEFAWRVKNWLRPLGFRKMLLPCPLMGTGMAFPWNVIRQANLASGHLVEDLVLSLELTSAGHAPIFCPSAIITSEFPASQAAAETQRQRWEHGHIGTIWATVPRTIVRSMTTRNWQLLALSLDAAVPPLSLLILLLACNVLLSVLAAILGGPIYAAAIGIGSSLLFASSLLMAWLTCGRDIYPARAFKSIGPRLYEKVRLYVLLLTRGAVSHWIRTDRD